MVKANTDKSFFFYAVKRLGASYDQEDSRPVDIYMKTNEKDSVSIPAGISGEIAGYSN